MLEHELGNKLQPKDVAQYTGLHVKTVRKYYRELGGMRLGRLYIFYERRVIDAISNRTKMEGPSAERQEQEGQNIQHQKGGISVGSQDEAKARRRVGREEDPFNLLT